MVLQDQNILFFTRTMALGGTENIILQLCEVFKPLVHNIVVCSCGGINEEKLSAMGIRHYTIPDIEKKSIHNLFTIPAELKKIIRQENITIIHTHHRMAAFYCQIVGLSKKIKYINTSHTAFYDKKRLTHLAFHGFNLISCGDGVKKSLTEGLGFRPDRIMTICNGIKKTPEEEGETIVQAVEAKETDKTVFAAIGRLSKEKGISYLIKAVSLLKQTNILCLVVGSGPEEAELKILTDSLHLSDKILFLGFRSDVKNIIRQVDFVVQPSLQEGLPLTPIEAFSQGKTVVGTDIEGTAEIIEDGVNGILVAPADEKALAEAIDRMSSDMEHRGKMEKQALQTYMNKYSFDVFADNYIKYYERL